MKDLIKQVKELYKQYCTGYYPQGSVEVVGAGDFAEVYKLTINGKNYALKTPSFWKAVSRPEFENLEKMVGSGVTPQPFGFLEDVRQEGFHCILMEFFNGVNFHNAMYRLRSNPHLFEYDTDKILVSVEEAIERFHERGLTIISDHYNIRNFMLLPDSSVRMIDLDGCQEFRGSDSFADFLILKTRILCEKIKTTQQGLRTP